jgi:hypothetical protein
LWRAFSIFVSCTYDSKYILRKQKTLMKYECNIETVGTCRQPFFCVLLDVYRIYSLEPSIWHVTYAIAYIHFVEWKKRHTKTEIAFVFFGVDTSGLQANLLWHLHKFYCYFKRLFFSPCQAIKHINIEHCYFNFGHALKYIWVIKKNCNENNLSTPHGR